MGKVKILQISPELLVDLFKPGKRNYEVVQDAVPADGKLVHVHVSQGGLLLNLTVESESFAPISLGDHIPVFSPTVTVNRLLGKVAL
jgi:hypothetical protein